MVNMTPMTKSSSVVRIALFATVVVSITACGIASPQSDLASPSQSVRDAAATVLRESFKPPSRTNWDTIIGRLKAGMPQTNVLAVLRAVDARQEGTGGHGNVDVERFRLDDLWVVECTFSGGLTNKTLRELYLQEVLREVWVDPPPDFTGTWTTYYVSGQPSQRASYKDGKPNGEGVAYYPDGAKCLVHHSVNGVADGEELSFFPSGQLHYKGTYKSGSHVGTWTWFNKDGSVESEKHY
jgi:hypothetical protein